MQIYKKVIGQGPTLVMLHGWGFHSGIWEIVLPKLVDHFQVILIDLPGFGYSQNSLNEYTLKNLAEIVLAITPEQATYLGWSLGGLVAMYIAIYFPKKINKLISVTSSPCFVEDENWPGISQTTLNGFLENIQTDFASAVQHFVRSQLLQSNITKTQLKQLKTILNVRNKSDINALTGGINILNKNDLRTEIAQVEIPQLYLFGRLDTLVPQAAHTKIQQLIPKAHCITLPKTGHLPFASHADEFSRIVKDFIND